MAGESGNFEHGTNWKAENAASIKLRAGDGKKHPVTQTRVAPTLSSEEIARGEARRLQERARLAAQRQDKKRRARGAQKAAALDARHAERDHTPDGWLPASSRGFVDPLSRAADPRRATAAPKRKKRRRKGGHELQ